MMGAGCQKIGQYTKGYLWFVSFENIFISDLFAGYFLYIYGIHFQLSFLQFRKESWLA